MTFFFKLLTADSCHLQCALIGIIFGLALQHADDVDFCAEHLIEEEVGAHIGLIDRDNGGQIKDRLQSRFAAGGCRLHCVVGLGCTVGEYIFRAFGKRITDQIFQFTDFVSAEEAAAC